ncbi:MAG: three-Cys-motif partner protein TcmP [Firmicutes bacterium]|uniref:Three-Cys-motif partner protein TcmP n=1 Tax=Candidatus Alloenteromonas pullistercoris TaxID=2840785 RepID=A0A9D9GV56_9FIRM|nr:three-Cys-motif partner protein TcmP [Candidatus Enteromonas pullistercoris]
MTKRNDDFFKSKKPWSETKDALLGCYLKPYFEKIKTLKTPICYIDGFAGKGKFDDGKDGSPRIALQVIRESIVGSNPFSKPIVNFYFVDLNYEDELKKNLESVRNLV